MRSDPALSFTKLFLYFHESRWMNDIKKNDLIKTRKRCNIFRFIDCLNFINDGGEFEISYHNIYHKELELRKVKSVKSLAIVTKIIETDTGGVL